MPCTCIETVNEKLKGHNTRLTIPMIIRFKGDPPSPERLFVQTEQIETGRGKAKAANMFTSYCPFCGVVQAADEAVEAA